MKSPTEIKNKIKQVKYEYLKQIYQDKLSVKPENCHYNKVVTLCGQKEIKTRVCTYFSDSEHYEICDTLECANSCNAFIVKHSKDVLKDRLDVDIQKNPNKYPEISVLSWVLQQKENLKISFLDKIKYELHRFFILVKGKIFHE